MLFKKLSEVWAIDKANYVKRSTMSTYKLIIQNHLLLYFVKMKDINETNIQKFINEKYEYGLHVKTIKDIVIVLNMIIKFAMKEGYIKKRTFDLIYPKETKNSITKVIKTKDERKILNYVLKHPTNQNIGLMLCLFTGLRVGEVCALKWQDIDFKNNQICVSRTIQRIYEENESDFKTVVIIDEPKTNSSYREIPINTEMCEILKKIKGKTELNCYILSNSIKPIEPRVYRNYFNKVLKNLNINHIKFHGLRHTFATRCIESGADVKTVSVLLGHRSIITTLNLYVHPNIEQKRRCINKRINQSMK